MSDTIWVAIITATPVLLVSFFNSYFQYKTNKSNSAKLVRYDVLKVFNNCACNFYSHKGFSSEKKLNYEKSLNEILIYFPNANTKFIQELEEARDFDNWNKYYPVLRKTIKYLSSLI